MGVIYKDCIYNMHESLHFFINTLFLEEKKSKGMHVADNINPYCLVFVLPSYFFNFSCFLYLIVVSVSIIMCHNVLVVSR